MIGSSAIKFLVVSVMLAGIAAPALADGEGDKFMEQLFNRQKGPSMSQGSEMSPVFENTPRATALIGKEVRSAENERLGTIDDLVIDRRGRVSHIVLSRGGVMGIGNELVAVPISGTDLKVNDEGRVVAAIDKSTVDAAPGFSRNNWPDLSNARTGGEVRGYFGGGHPARDESMGYPGQRDP